MEKQVDWSGKNKTCSICLKEYEFGHLSQHIHKVQIDNEEFVYEPFYDRLKAVKKETIGCIRCVDCHNDNFRISYGNYECIANCSCGNSFVIYEG